jgi:hypothetical protein
MRAHEGHRHLLACACVMLALAPVATTQEAERRLPDEPLLWAYGADDLGSLPYVKSLGLNTVMLEMKAPLTPDELQRAKRTVQEAQEYGLHVIVGLPLTMHEIYSTTLANRQYVKGIGEYVREVVAALKDEPGIIGWAAGDYLERDLQVTDGEFQDYLLHKYGSVAELQAAWGVKVTSVRSITMEATPKLDDDLPFAMGMPSVDLADFQALKYREMMQFWADLVRGVTDNRGLLFTGRVTLYRSLPNVPDDYDVIVISMPPALLEPDWITHNVQGIDIARRCGKRKVIPCLRLFLPGEAGELALIQALPEWMMEAAVHGASGLSFEAPPEVLGEPVVQDQWREALKWMADQPAWDSRPRGAAAILYEPYADGFEALGVPVYGYIKGLSNREPTDLFHSFSRGTRYGGVDCLTLADLAAEDLSRYSVILAPMALNLPEEAQQRLTDYVKEGGVLLADIGAGFVQTGSWRVLPPQLAALCGITGFTEMKSMAGNLTIHQPHHVLPSLPSGAETKGDFEGGVPGRITGPGGYAMSGWTGFAEVPSGTTPLARLAMSLTEDKKPTFAGIVAHDVGTGTALFVTHRLWSNWLPQHRLFEAFHGDLWQRRATVELLDAKFVAPAMEICENENGSVTLYNPGRAQRIQVALYAAEHRLFEGAVCQFTSLLVGETGLRTGGVLATLDAAQHTSLRLAPTPIEVRPYDGVTTACVTSYEPERIALIVGGQGSAPAGRPGRLTISPGHPERVRVTISSGRYAVEPRSRHVVRTSDPGESAAEQTLTADNQGRLLLELTGRDTTVEIRPG